MHLIKMYEAKKITEMGKFTITVGDFTTNSVIDKIV